MAEASPSTSSTSESANRKAYAAFAALVTIGLVTQQVQEYWSGDVWTHAATFRSFIEDGLSPAHPFLNVDAPAHTFTVYHQFWGVVARLADLAPLTVMKVAGVVNLLLFLAVFPGFVRLFVDRPAAPLVALVLTLFAWGPLAWRFSGFLHLNAIGFGLPFPSMFATAFGMGAVVVMARKQRSRLLPIGSVLAGFILSNIHLITFGSIALFLTALSMTRRVPIPVLVAFIGGALTGAWLWPYYDMFDLVLGGASNIDQENAVLYEGVISRIALATPGAALTARDWYRRRVDALPLATALLFGAWLFGAVVGVDTIGRVMPALVLTLHLRMTRWLLAEVDSEHSDNRRRIAVGCAIGLALGAYFMAPAVPRLIPKAILPTSVATHPSLGVPSTFLQPIVDFVAGDDVVLAPLTISSQIPAFAGKVVASRPMPFVDQSERYTAVTGFFVEPDRRVLDRYDVSWLIYTPESDSRSLRSLGEPAYEDGDLVILRVRPQPTSRSDRSDWFSTVRPSSDATQISSIRTPSSPGR